MAEYRGFPALLAFLCIIIFVLVILVLVLHVIILLIPIAIVVIIVSWMLHVLGRKKRKPAMRVSIKKF